MLGIIEDHHHLIEFRTNNFLEVFPEMHLEKDYNTDINQKINEFNQNVIVTEAAITETVYQYNIDYSPGDDRNDKVIYKFTKINNNTTQLQFLHEDRVDWATITMPRYTRKY